MILTLLLALLLASPDTAQAQTLIQGATVHTGDGRTLPRADLLIQQDGTIAALSTTPLTPPPGAAVVDARGLILTPGFIDANTQLGLVDVWAVKESVDTGPEQRPFRPALRAADAFNPRNLAIPITRSGGVTTVAVTPSQGILSGQLAVAHLHSPSPRAWATLRPTPAGIALHLDEAATRYAEGDRAERLLRLRELLDDARFLLKNPRALDDARAHPLAASRLDLLALAPVLQGELPLFVHAHRAADIEAALRLAAEQRLRLVIVGGDEAWLVADQLAAARVPVLLNPLDNLPASLDRLGAREDNPALLRDAGVTFALTTGDAHNVRNLRFLASNAVRAGLTWDEALAAITATPARLLGLDATHGRIAPGLRADLALWSDDPLDAPGRLRALYIDGRPVPLDASRQDALFHRYHATPGATP